ncbi:hypothetical protein HDV00_009242 [Rhizophlyctis rosea]|nr:hypothetical protein HDV00_009242 [Rhizophlyctis rosea]
MNGERQEHWELTEAAKNPSRAITTDMVKPAVKSATGTLFYLHITNVNLPLDQRPRFQSIVSDILNVAKSAMADGESKAKMRGFGLEVKSIDAFAWEGLLPEPVNVLLMGDLRAPVVRVAKPLPRNFKKPKHCRRYEMDGFVELYFSCREDAYSYYGEDITWENGMKALIDGNRVGENINDLAPDTKKVYPAVFVKKRNATSPRANEEKRSKTDGETDVGWFLDGIENVQHCLLITTTTNQTIKSRVAHICNPPSLRWLTPTTNTKFVPGETVNLKWLWLPNGSGIIAQGTDQIDVVLLDTRADANVDGDAQGSEQSDGIPMDTPIRTTVGVPVGSSLGSTSLQSGSLTVNIPADVVAGPSFTFRCQVGSTKHFIYSPQFAIDGSTDALTAAGKGKSVAPASSTPTAEGEEEGEGGLRLWLVFNNKGKHPTELFPTSHANLHMRTPNNVPSYLSISGTVTIIDEIPKIRTIWNADIRSWLTNGDKTTQMEPTDPNITLLSLRIHSALRYIDSTSIPVLLYDETKTNSPPSSPTPQHQQNQHKDPKTPSKPSTTPSDTVSLANPASPPDNDPTANADANADANAEEEKEDGEITDDGGSSPINDGQEPL